MVFPIHKLRYLSCVRPFCDAEQSASYVFILYTYWRKISMQNSGGHLDRCGFLLFSHKICRIWTAHTASRMCIKLHAPFPVAPQGRGSGTFLILLHFCIAKKEHHPDGWCSYLELLTRFELVTSSLPTTVEPSSPCCIRLCGVFLSKKDEVAACLFHCFRPLISPCGSRCGSNNFQDANEGRTSDSGKPSRCALSRS